MTTYLEDLEAKQRETAERVEAARVDVAWLSTLYARHGAPQDARRLAKGATDAADLTDLLYTLQTLIHAEAKTAASWGSFPD